MLKGISANLECEKRNHHPLTPPQHPVKIPQPITVRQTQLTLHDYRGVPAWVYLLELASPRGQIHLTMCLDYGIYPNAGVFFRVPLGLTRIRICAKTVASSSLQKILEERFYTGKTDNESYLLQIH